MNPLIALALEQTPNLILALKAAFVKRHPDLPEPTSEEIIAAYNSAFVSTVAKDDAFLAAHPDGGGL